MSISRTCVITVFLVSATIAFACGSQPISLAALPGSTISLAVGGEDVSGAFVGVVGFGSEVLEANGISDIQRGRLQFVLIGSDSSEHLLETKLVTRVYPDPTSQIGIQNASTSAPLAQLLGISQIVALVDIPANVPPGDYSIEIRRISGGTQIGTVPYPFSMKILDPTACGGIGQSNPLLGWVYGSTHDTTGGLGELYPQPKVVIDLGVTPPAAAHLVVGYPSGVAVKTVIEEQNFGRGSLVLWQDDPVAREVTIDFADPAASVRFLAVAFEPDAPVTIAGFGLTATLYDRDGGPLGSQPTLTKIR